MPRRSPLEDDGARVRNGKWRAAGSRGKVFGLKAFAVDMEVDMQVDLGVENGELDLHLWRGVSGTWKLLLLLRQHRRALRAERGSGVRAIHTSWTAAS